MGCSTCTAGSIERQEAVVAAIDQKLDATFGKYGATKEPSRVEVLDTDSMRTRWADVRKQMWRQKYPMPADPKEIGKYANTRKVADRAIDELSSTFTPGAFAAQGTVFVSPELDERSVTHEAIHLKMNPKAQRWLVDNTDPIVANQMNESLTEYFNRQMTGGISTKGDKYHTRWTLAEYGAGVDVIRELRDERLGGPELGEERLRRFFFGGDTSAFDAANVEPGQSLLGDEYAKRLVHHTESNRDQVEAERAAYEASLTP